MKKSRTVGQRLPSLAVPEAGTVNLPAAMAAFAAAKNAGALQYEYWPNMLPFKPLTHLASARLVVPAAFLRSRLLPLYPILRATTAPAGSVGTTGATNGSSPLSTTTGL